MAKKAPKQVLPILANRHPNKDIEELLERGAAIIYPTGCHILFGRIQAYIMPTDWYAGPGIVVHYSDGLRIVEEVTISHLAVLKTDKPDPDLFGWLRQQ